MDGPTQDDHEPAAPSVPTLPPALDPALEAPAPAPMKPNAGPRLGLWLGVLVVGGVVGALLHQSEGAVLLALAGAFVTAQAADLDDDWQLLHVFLAGVIMVLAAAVFFAIAMMILNSDTTGFARPLGVGLAGGATLLCLLTLFRPFANSLATTMFRTEQPDRTLRLAARLALVCLLVALPGQIWFRTAIDSALLPDAPFAEPAALVGSLVGYVVLAFGAVGLGIQRNFRETLERLGLTAMSLKHAVVAVLGTGALLAVNTGLEFVEKRVFPDLWRLDQDATKMIAGDITPVTALVLGLSAGIGEEITVRGALQPRLGLLLSSLVFAALHVQYSWFGMATVMIFGLLLGSTRKWTNTTTVIVIHTAYDVIAALQAR